jgi:hypothetical protein
VPTFFEFSQALAAVKDHIGDFIRRATLGVLEEVRIDLEGDRRIGVAKPMLDFRDRSATRY